MDDEIVTVSDKEEFWIKDEKWVQAKDLEEGDLLQTEDIDFVAVDGIEVREGSYEVYNRDDLRSWDALDLLSAIAPIKFWAELTRSPVFT